MRNLQIPLQPSTPFSHDYLKASNHRQQALCGNVEGWGPLSPDRFDFTPCFLDVWVAVVAAGGVLGGAAAAYYLLRHCPSQPVKKNWHFFAKLVRLITVSLFNRIKIDNADHFGARPLLECLSSRPPYKQFYRPNTIQEYGCETSGFGPPSSLYCPSA